MIDEIDGRFRSSRSSAELEEIVRKEIQHLTPAEREALAIMAKEMEQNPEGSNLLQTIEESEYKEKPVDIRTFVMDDYFLGATCNNLYPKYLDDLEEFFSGGYNEFIITGAIGVGKTFVASVGMCRILYELSCLANPQKSLGLASDTNVSLVGLSVNENLAIKVVFENIATKLLASPYFSNHFPFKDTKKELRFPNNIWVAARATTDTSVLGLNLLAALIDETNFYHKASLKETMAGIPDRAEAIYAGIRRRIKSRFERRGRNPGKVFVVSSKKTNDDFTAKRIRGSKTDSSVFVRDYCLTGDTKIPLLTGETLTLKELADTRATSTFWVYSVDSKGLIVPGRAHSPRLTQVKAPILKIGLDNGEFVRATPWHPFMLRSGEYKNAEELKVGDSLMPLYRKIDEKGYETVGQPAWNGRWQKTHHMVAKTTYGPWPAKGKDNLPTVIHHVNHNKRDNTPDNLAVMEWTSHQDLHKRDMTSLLNYVKTERHHEYASAHMTRLHQDPKFATERDARGGARLKRLWADPVYSKKMRETNSVTLTKFLTSEEGRVSQKEKAKAYWSKNRKFELTQIFEAKHEGLSLTEAAARFGCSPGAISSRLKYNGYPSYPSLKENHKVLSVEISTPEDVYDLTVDEYHNFALEAGVFVHNCIWDLRPEQFLSSERFYVLAGNEATPSRLLEDHEVEATRASMAEGCQIVAVPEDFKDDFVRDLEGSLNDIAGVSTVAVNPFISKREKILDAIDKTRVHPFSTLVYDPSKGGQFVWNKMVRPTPERGFSLNPTSPLRPIINPKAVRHIHIDPSLSGDATGLCMAHIGGFKAVERKTDEGDKYIEKAPIYVVDLILQVVPPVGGEIILAELRHMIYALNAHGYTIGHVSLDQFQSSDFVQMLNTKGFNAERVSVDISTEPYENLKTALYEDRISYYEYPPLIAELQKLERKFNGRRLKIDHPNKGSKDLSDALAAVCSTLNSAQGSDPLPIMRGNSYNTDAWMSEQVGSRYAGNKNEGAEKGIALPAFFKGSGSGNDWDGSGGSGGWGNSF